MDFIATRFNEAAPKGDDATGCAAIFRKKYLKRGFDHKLSPARAIT